jgi:putative transcriptional regulator
MKAPGLQLLRITALLYLLVWLSAPCSAAAGQRAGSDSDELKPGIFLVAPRRAADPNFAGTVVLLVRLDETGALGLVINHPMDIPISRVLQDRKEASRLDGNAFSGGPVQADAALALYRSAKKFDDASAILKEVYLVSTRSALDRIINSKPTAKNFRLYLGYTGWGPGQLQHEMELDVWRILPGDAKSVFDPEPSSVWPRLIDRLEMRFALDRYGITDLMR